MIPAIVGISSFDILSFRYSLALLFFNEYVAIPAMVKSSCINQGARLKMNVLAITEFAAWK